MHFILFNRDQYGLTQIFYYFSCTYCAYTYSILQLHYFVIQVKTKGGKMGVALLYNRLQVDHYYSWC